MEFVFRNQKKSRNTRIDSCADTHWTFQGLGEEKKWYGTFPYTLEGKWDSTANQMVNDSKTQVIQYSRVSCFESWNSEKKWQRHLTFQRECSGSVCAEQS